MANKKKVDSPLRLVLIIIGIVVVVVGIISGVQIIENSTHFRSDAAYAWGD